MRQKSNITNIQKILKFVRKKSVCRCKWSMLTTFERKKLTSITHIYNSSWAEYLWTKW